MGSDVYTRYWHPMRELVLVADFAERVLLPASPEATADDWLEFARRCHEEEPAPVKTHLELFAACEVATRCLDQLADLKKRVRRDENLCRMVDFALVEFDFEPLIGELWSLLRYMPAAGQQGKPERPGGGIGPDEARLALDALANWCRGEMATNRSGAHVPEERSAVTKSHAAESGVAKTSKSDRFLWIARAMLLVNEHPDCADAEIARQVGKSASTLSRNAAYKAAARCARGRREDRPRGHIVADDEGRFAGIEAYHGDDPAKMEWD